MFESYCSLCHGHLRQVVLPPCCGGRAPSTSACRACALRHLAKSGGTCWVNGCGLRVSPDGLVTEAEAEAALPPAPEDLSCSICAETTVDAVMTPCCAEAACEACGKEQLREEGGRCWVLSCRDALGAEGLIPNWNVRKKAQEYRDRVFGPPTKPPTQQQAEGALSFLRDIINGHGKSLPPAPTAMPTPPVAQAQSILTPGALASSPPPSLPAPPVLPPLVSYSQTNTTISEDQASSSSSPVITDEIIVLELPQQEGGQNAMPPPPPPSLLDPPPPQFFQIRDMSDIVDESHLLHDQVLDLRHFVATFP